MANRNVIVSASSDGYYVRWRQDGGDWQTKWFPNGIELATELSCMMFEVEDLKKMVTDISECLDAWDAASDKPASMLSSEIREIIKPMPF